MTEEGYRGRAVIRGSDRTITVDVRLAGHVEPVDGRYHWGGRVDPDEDVVALVREGTRGVTISIGSEPGRPARLGQPDPWGGVRISGVGVPPWHAAGTERAA